MKSLLYLSILSILFCFTSCKIDTSNKSTIVEQENIIAKTSAIVLPFVGSWSREFKMGEGVEQKVNYIIDNNKIKYVMSGAMPMSYDIVMDTFVASDNRWIGHKGDTPYVIFVKDITVGSINLFKRKVSNIEEGLSISVPSDTTRSKFTSWNVYNVNAETK